MAAARGRGGGGGGGGGRVACIKKFNQAVLSFQADQNAFREKIVNNRCV